MLFILEAGSLRKVLRQSAGIMLHSYICQLFRIFDIALILKLRAVFLVHKQNADITKLLTTSETRGVTFFALSYNYVPDSLSSFVYL